MTEKIKSCPFCGGEVDVEEHTRFSREKMYYVECRNNECTTMPSTELCHSKEDAIKKWNTRKPMDRIVELLERARKSPDAYVYAEDAYIKAIEIVKVGTEQTI